jgi:uncharacterized membrane protein
VPESKGRKKATYTPPPRRSAAPTQSPVWYAPVMVAFFVVGLTYIVVFYLTSGELPVAKIGAWNIVVGFGIIMLGFGMATRWR